LPKWNPGRAAAFVYRRMRGADAAVNIEMAKSAV